MVHIGTFPRALVTKCGCVGSEFSPAPAAVSDLITQGHREVESLCSSGPGLGSTLIAVDRELLDSVPSSLSFQEHFARGQSQPVPGSVRNSLSLHYCPVSLAGSSWGQLANRV